MKSLPGYQMNIERELLNGCPLTIEILMRIDDNQ